MWIRPEEAIAAYRQAIHLRSGYIKAHNNLAHLLKQRDCLEEALACYRHVLQLEPASADANNNLGVTLHALGRLDEAAAYFRARDPAPARARIGPPQSGRFQEQQGHLA